MSLWVSTTAPKVLLDAADGDEAECVRERFRERVSSPCGEDGEVETAGHPPGGGGCAALFPSSRCMEEPLFVSRCGKLFSLLSLSSTSACKLSFLPVRSDAL